MNNFNICLFKPLSSNRALHSSVGPACGIRISRPKYNHFCIFQTILNPPIGFTLSHSQRLTPVMNCPPVPAFPAIGIMVHSCHSYGINKTKICTQIIANISPRMVGSMGICYSSWPVNSFCSFYLVCHQV